MRVALAMSLAGSLALCTPAFGATTVRIDGLKALITDESDERNALTIAVSDTKTEVTIRDSAAKLEAGEGCVARPPDAVSCTTDILTAVRAELGGGPDSAEVIDDTTTCDCVFLIGGGGRDRLVGGPGGDRLIGGRGPDSAFGGADHDMLRGDSGEDFLVGGSGGANPGRDALDGGPGHDQLDDGDGTSIGPDTVIGGPDLDEVFSYFTRTEPVMIDLRKHRRNDGEQGERDMLVNVESVEAGDGNDRLIGDGDGNVLYGGRGVDRIDGRGGSDSLFDYDANRNKLKGGQGRDSLVVTRFGTGPVRCGRGRDSVAEDLPGRDEPQGGEGLRGPWISGTCEAIAFGIDPVPNAPVSGRTIKFGVAAGGRPDEDFYLALSGVGEPFAELGRGQSTPNGITVRLPAEVAERARRDGFQFRADLNNPENPRQRVVWRFRQKPAR